jgi:hypothetical protein
MDTMTINIFDKNETFARTGVDVRNGGTVLDFAMVGNNSVKAVVLVDRTPGDAERPKKFDATYRCYKR